MFREMARKKQTLSQEECLNILKQEPRGVLAVLGDEDYPYAVPMDHWYCEADGKLYFHSGKKGHKIDAIRRHEKASFCVFDQGFRREGEWALNIKSVIVFGRVELIEDPEKIEKICRSLSYKYTSDSAYIEEEIRRFAANTLCFALVPEQISGKMVNES
ncbi:MAG: pyridoxamine 5'-phosphate oxidase family protein [Clostridia bacterium]|nr:pyridoxamine 5'-phosphate oxidase family protein [Clostridia bacterium]